MSDLYIILIKMLKKVKCPNCGTVNHVNPEKHKFRPKYCTSVRCRAIIDNAHPKRRIMSGFQRKKWERKEATRSRFIQRMIGLGRGMDRISKMLIKIFKSEKEVQRWSK